MAFVNARFQNPYVIEDNYGWSTLNTRAELAAVTTRLPNQQWVMRGVLQPYNATRFSEGWRDATQLLAIHDIEIDCPQPAGGISLAQSQTVFLADTHEEGAQAIQVSPETVIDIPPGRYVSIARKVYVVTFSTPGSGTIGIYPDLQSVLITGVPVNLYPDFRCRKSANFVRQIVVDDDNQVRMSVELVERLG